MGLNYDIFENISDLPTTGLNYDIFDENISDLPTMGLNYDIFASVGLTYLLICQHLQRFCTTDTCIFVFIEEGWKQKARLRSSGRFGGQNLLNSLPR